MQSPVNQACPPQPLVPRSIPEHEIFNGLPECRRVLVLGSTGSIGKSTLEIIEKFPDKFVLAGVVALGSNPALFAEQIRRFSPTSALVLNGEKRAEIESLSGRKILCGQEDLLELCASSEVDIVVAGVVGAAGLAPVLAALKARKIVALANKESLVVGGEVVRKVSKLVGARILPVDSEHSAIFQCLLGIREEEISSLILTASGGPFLRTKLEELRYVTPEQAIKHPRWQMGPKISVDSATLMNKALELIEAHYLYAVPANRLSAVIHPQSLVHSVVQIKDGTSLFQASYPDMKEPIAFALNYPKLRLEPIVPKLDLAGVGSLLFEEIDAERFPAVQLAIQAIGEGSIACIVLNEANEYAVGQFLSGRLRFIDIIPFIQEVLSKNFNQETDDLSGIDSLRKEISSICDFVIKKFKLD